MLAWAAMLTACSGTVTVRPLVTGRADVAAYELQGGELTALRREATRLCPNGGDVLRQAGYEERPEKEDGRVRGWLNATGEWLSPAKRAAQMVVVCKEVKPSGVLPSQAELAAAKSAAAASANAEAASRNLPTPVMPTGPITAEW